MHLEITGYLLTVLTFSVGFLSTRRHAHFDVLSKDIADRSWKIRQALNAGQNLGPRDLAEDIIAVKVEADAVSTFARVVNAFFFVSAGVVAGLGMFDPRPPHEVAFLAIVLVATTLVFALGEFDVQWMSAKERDLARDTVLGQLAVIDGALRKRNGGAAMEEVSRIRETYPHWSFGRELQLSLAATALGYKTSDTALDLLDSESPLHSAPFLAVEQQLRDGNPVGALHDFHVVSPRSVPSRAIEQLNLVVGFTMGLPRSTFTAPSESQLSSRDPDGLELGLSSLPAIARATESLRDFGSDMKLAEWIERQPESPPLMIARAATVDSNEFSDLLTVSHEPMFNGALNSLGIVALARGEDNDALRVFEAAIRLRPNSSTSHWGRAVACARRGWHDAAEESLARAMSLDPSAPHIIAATRDAFTDGHAHATHEGAPTAARNGWESLQFALIGRRSEAAKFPTGPRAELLQILLSSALDTVAVRS